jgi:hypothetical protein
MAAVGGPVPPAVHEPAAAVRWLGKPGPAYPGFPAQGASAPLGGRAWPWALPRQREKGLPGRGVSESAGRGAPKEGRGPKGSTGEGTPRRDPGGPAGRSRPNGRARSGLLDQPQPSPGWEMGRGARGSPRDGHRRNRGEAPRPLARGVGAAAKGARGPSGRGISGPQGCPYPEGPTLIPPAHRRGVSALWGATFAKVRFCAGVTLLRPKAAHRPSPPARPLPPGPG